MTAYSKMTPAEREAEYARLQGEFEALKARGLTLNMARGKPSRAQLDMVSDIFGLMQRPEDYMSDGIDVRNYGELRAGAGVRGRQRQPPADVRHRRQSLHPRPAPQSPPLVQGGDGEVALSSPRL